MTTGKITIPDNLLRTVGLAATLIGTGWVVSQKLAGIEGKLDTIVWDICHQSQRPDLLRSCDVRATGLQAQGMPR